MRIRDKVSERVRDVSARRVAWALVILSLAAFVRLHNLEARGAHWDEGVHAYYSWEFLTTGEFTYEPWRHGPFLYYLSVPFMRLFGESIASGRTAVAVVSLGMLPALYLLRDELPLPAIVFSSLMLALHPYVVHTARFYRNDVMLATFMLLSIGSYARYYRTGRRAWAAGIGVTAGLAFASKEVAFLILPAVAAPILVVMHFHARFETGSIRTSLLEFLPPKHLLLVPVGFLAVIVFFFGGWPLEATDSFGKFLSGLTYWLSEGQAEEGRVTFYLDWIVAGTPVLFALMAVGIAGAVLRPDSSWFRWIFVAWASFITLVLSLIGDQSWWNVVLLFPPIALLAGYGVTDAWLGARRFADAARERFGIRTGPTSPDEIASTRQILGIVLPIIAAGVALAIVIGAVPAPEAVAGLESPNQTTGFGIQGITVHEQTDTRDRAFQAAREAALQTGCPAFIGPDVYPWPAKWWFRGIEHEHVTELEEDDRPGVVVTTNPSLSFEEQGYRTLAFEEYRVYVPPDNCAVSRI